VQVVVKLSQQRDNPLPAVEKEPGHFAVGAL
jgi:hypothetical protein